MQTLPLKIIDNDRNEEVDENEVFKNNKSDKVDEDVPIFRVFLSHFSIHEIPVIQSDQLEKCERCKPCNECLVGKV